MKPRRKTTRLILFGIFCLLLLLLSIPFLAILANLYCQTFGLPIPVKEKILSSLKNQGILVELDEIKAGLFTGVYLQNVIIKDSELSNCNLLLAQKILVEFDINRFLQGEFKLTEIKIEGGILSIPLTANESDTTRPVLRIKNINCQIEDMGDEFKIIAFRGLWEGINLSMEGNVIKPPEEEKDHLKFSLTVKPLLRYITPGVIDIFNSMDNFLQSLNEISEANISLDLTLPVANIKKSTISADVFFSEVLFRGLNLKTLAFTGEFTTQLVELSDFRLEFDDSEYLRGHFEIEIPTNEISSRLSFYGYPYKILKAVAPHMLNNKQFPLPQFQGAPMSAAIRVYPSPLSKIDQWNVDTKFTASNIELGDLSILALDGNGKFRNNQIDFDTVKARVAPDIDVLMNGQWLTEEKQLLIKAEVTGDPNFTSEFIKNKKAREIYKKVWEDFDWASGDRPYFYVNLYLDMISRPSLKIQARSKMSNFFYKGVKIDRGTGQFFLGFPESIFIFDNLEVIMDGQEGIAKLVWYGKPTEMEFELKSNITPPSVLALFNRNWIDFLENKGLVFQNSPDVCTQGRFSPRNPAGTEIDIELDGTDLNYQSALINNFHGSIKIVDKLITIKTNIGTMNYEDWVLEDAQAEIEIKKENTAIIGNINNIKGLGILLTNTDFVADCEKGKVYTNSNTQTITFGEWQLNNVEGNSVYEVQDLKSNGTIESATFRNIEFDSITTDIVFKDDGLTAELDIDGANIDDEVEITGIEGNLSIANNRAEMTGIIFEMLHLPTKGLSHNLQTTCSYSEKNFDIQVETDYFNYLTHGALNRVTANVSIDAGLLYGTYDIGELFWKDKIRIQNLTGNFDGYNAPWSFRSRCDEISFPFCKLLKVSSTGSISENRLKSSVSSEVCQINRYTFKNVTAAVTNENDNLSINRITGNIYGGRTTGEIFYNEARKNGRIWLTAVDVDFEELVNAIQSESDRRMGGKLSGKVDLNFTNQPNEVDLTGNGKIFIEKGNLWKVPLLSDFLQALAKMKIIKLVVPQEEIGGITELSSDIEFQGKKVYFQNMKTNGNIVLITADGYYGWNTNDLDFRVKAKPLNPFFGNFIPEAIDPFSILLERRLLGKLSNPKWEEVSAIRDLFRTKEEKSIEPSL